MILRRLALCILTLYISAAFLANTALAQTRITTLVAKEARSVPARSDNMLKISTDESDPIKSTSHVMLTFVLDPIPAQSKITGATLRLVGNPAARNVAEATPQLVTILPINYRTNDPIGQWSARPGESVFTATGESLSQAIAWSMFRGTAFIIELTSRSRLSDWNYYGLSDKDFPSSFKPRLIVEYELPSKWQAFTQDTTRTPGPFQVPRSAGAMATPFHQELKFISNPGFFNNRIFVFGQTTAPETFLYEFLPSGPQTWSQKTSPAPGSHVLIRELDGWYIHSPNDPSNGRNMPNRVDLYSVGNDHIVRYQLFQTGAPWKGLQDKMVSVPDLKLDVPPTLGADGSLYFVRSGYVYGLDPNLQELWRYPEKGAGATTYSRVTLSDGERYAYFLTQQNKENKLVSIDTSDGSATTTPLSSDWTGFQRALVVKGPEKDYVIVAAYSHDDGTLSAYSDGQLLWQKPGTVSQPIVDRTGERVFAIQKGTLHEYNLLNGAAVCNSAETDLEADSNPVLDVDNNLYVWSNGTLLGYTNTCHRFWIQRLELPKTLELLFTPGGDLLARTATDHLFLINPK